MSIEGNENSGVNIFFLTIVYTFREMNHNVYIDIIIIIIIIMDVSCHRHFFLVLLLNQQ